MPELEFDSDKVILVMGIQGAGKTSFINHLVPHVLEINHGLSAHENDFVEHCIPFAGNNLILVDTPSMDNGEDIFKKAAQWLSDRYNRVRLADGVLILYPINRTRLSESCMTYSSLRRGLMEVLDVGVESASELHRVILATTMWPENSESSETAIEYLQTEENLRQEWLPLLKRGADLRICANTPDFAKEAISDMLMAQRRDMSFMRNALIIAVIGCSQSGKTSLVNLLTKIVSPLYDSFPEVEVFASLVEVNGENVVLLDTPGLETRGEVFDMISKWLRRVARRIGKSSLYLDGIILTHSIHSGLNGIVPQAFLIDQANAFMGRLEKIFDERDINAYQRIVFATTMWDQIGTWEDIENAQRKEAKILANHWNIMHAARSSMVRFDNTSDTARRIVQKIVEEKKSGDAAYELRRVMMKELDSLKSDVKRLDTSMHERVMKELGDLKSDVSRLCTSMAAQKKELDDLKSDVDCLKIVQKDGLDKLTSDVHRIEKSMTVKQEELGDLKWKVDRLSTYTTEMAESTTEMNESKQKFPGIQ